MTPTPRILAPALALAGAAMLAAPAAAQSIEDDRFTFKASAFHADSRIVLGGDGRARTPDFPFSIAFGAREELQARDTRPHFQATWRFADRHRLMAAHYDVAQGRRYPFDRTITANEFPDEQARVFGEAGFDIEFELVNLMYEYALIQDERWTLGLSLGLHWARLDAHGDLTATGEYDGQTRTEQLDYSWQRRRYAPSIGARVAYRPTPRWQIAVDAQGFDTSWGNFTSEDGHYERIGFNAEYRVTRNLGVHAGYDWFRLKIADDFRGSLAGDDITYNGRWRGELRVHGPTLGLTLAF